MEEMEKFAYFIGVLIVIAVWVIALELSLIRQLLEKAFGHVDRKMRGVGWK